MFILTLWGLCALLAACSPDQAEAPAAEPNRAGSSATTPVPAIDYAATPLIIFLGDSLTAGPGLSQEETYPALIQAQFGAAGRYVRIVNAGVSGDTTAGGLERLSWMLQQKPDIVVIALGANDGLRGLPVDLIERNLRAILSKVNEAGAQCVLAGIQMPPNYGEDYAKEFAAVFPRVARETETIFVPFLLEGVGGVPELNLSDGLHPNAAGHKRVAENVLAGLEELLPAK
jgi:acyl-CoA thioesterase-1